MIGYHTRTPQLHPPVPFGPKVKLPKAWVKCPLCGKHYIIRGKPSFVLCAKHRD